MGAYLRNRLSESSTWRGLILLGFGLAGVEISENDVLTLVAAGQLLAGLVGVLLPDRVRP